MVSLRNLVAIDGCLVHDMDFLIEILGNSQMLDAELEDINPVVVEVQGMDVRQLMLDSLRSAGL